MKNDTARDGKVSCSAASESQGPFPGRAQPEDWLPRLAHCALLCRSSWSTKLKMANSAKDPEKLPMNPQIRLKRPLKTL